MITFLPMTDIFLNSYYNFPGVAKPSINTLRFLFFNELKSQAWLCMMSKNVGSFHFSQIHPSNHEIYCIYRGPEVVCFAFLLLKFNKVFFHEYPVGWWRDRQQIGIEHLLKRYNAGLLLFRSLQCSDNAHSTMSLSHYKIHFAKISKFKAGSVFIKSPQWLLAEKFCMRGKKEGVECILRKREKMILKW